MPARRRRFLSFYLCTGKHKTWPSLLSFLFCSEKRRSIEDRHVWMALKESPESSSHFAYLLRIGPIVQCFAWDWITEYWVDSMYDRGNQLWEPSVTGIEFLLRIPANTYLFSLIPGPKRFLIHEYFAYSQSLSLPLHFGLVRSRVWRVTTGSDRNVLYVISHVPNG